jgi:hypothetical protein
MFFTHTLFNLVWPHYEMTLFICLLNLETLNYYGRFVMNCECYPTYFWRFESVLCSWTKNFNLMTSSRVLYQLLYRRRPISSQLKKSDMARSSIIYKCGMNDGISASCKTAWQPWNLPLRLCHAWNVFVYDEKVKMFQWWDCNTWHYDDVML